MNIKIVPGKLCGRLAVPSSKSYAHRAVLAAALADRPTEIFLNCFSEDILSTAECINALGAECECDEKNGVIRVVPIATVPEKCCLNAGESGSTARFLLPAAAALCGSVAMTGKGRLPERPMTPLIREMKKNGVVANGDKLPIETRGLLKSGEYSIEGNISSQYITGLLFALLKLDKKSEIRLLSPLESKGYIDITLDVLEKFGAEIKKENFGFSVYPSKLKSPEKYYVEADWSNAAFFAVANALGSKIELLGLGENSKQGDRKIVDIIDMFSKNGDKKIDAADIPDLVPIISTLALKNIGTTKIYNAQRLRIKESDRIKTTVAALSAFGGELFETEDGIVIKGKGTIKGGGSKAYNDHRIAMSLAVASTIAENPCIIEGAECVKKSYPKFFEDFESLEGKINVIR